MTKKQRIGWLSVVAVSLAALLWLLSLLPDAVLLAIGNLLVIGAAIAQTLFAGIYGLTTPWWSSAFGKALLFKSSAIALLLDLSVLGNLVDLPVLVVFAVVGAIFVGSWWQLGALLSEKRAGRRERAGAMHSTRGELLPTDQTSNPQE